MHYLTIVLIVFISCSCGKPMRKHLLQGFYSGVGRLTVLLAANCGLNNDVLRKV